MNDGDPSSIQWQIVEYTTGSRCFQYFVVEVVDVSPDRERMLDTCLICKDEYNPFSVLILDYFNGCLEIWIERGHRLTQFTENSWRGSGG